MAKSILELSGVIKRYGATLGVGPVDVDLREGEFLTLLGPSGCGKTTTLHIVAGLLSPDEGCVLLGGRDVTRLDPQHRDMGVVFQNYALFPHKTVFDNVAFGLRMRGMPRHDIVERVGRMLTLVGLPGVETRLPGQLSGGQRQRVALARALVIEPTILLLDEPLSNLDAVLRKRMRLDLRDLQQRLGIATIFVTHDQDEAFEMSDRVVLLNHGRIEQIGTPEELYDDPTTRFAAEFIGETNLIEGVVVVAAAGPTVTVDTPEGVRYDAVAPDARLQSGDAVYVMIRPERIDLLTERPAGGLVMAVTVTKRVFAGDIIAFELRTDRGLLLRSTKPSVVEYRALSPGTRVWAVVRDCRALRRDGGAVSNA
ncbi:MAG TPA: ABC transporter ATP-binding protein [Candidatus Methylomirabilis sp.]|nr:ABC transporter ATP-binding protein [Candidatus Methylomirabilis sp.]